MKIRYNEKEISFEELESLSAQRKYNLNINQYNFSCSYKRISLEQLTRFLGKTKSLLESSLINITDTK